MRAALRPKVRTYSGYDFWTVYKGRECSNAKKEFEFGQVSWAGVWQKSVKEKETVGSKRDCSKQGRSVFWFVGGGGGPSC